MVFRRILVLIFITANLFLTVNSFLRFGRRTTDDPSSLPHEEKRTFIEVLRDVFIRFLHKINDRMSLPLEERQREMKEAIRYLFTNSLFLYVKYAYPHDELKPISGTATDSFGGFGNVKHKDTTEYRGSAITLIESLTSLAIMDYHKQFNISIRLLIQVVNFDVDTRINLYEWNTRVLGGLVSAHILATNLLQESYNNELLNLANDLGRRFLPAFDTPTGLPYAWVNLKYGILDDETTETTTEQCGALILEMGVLSRLTSDKRFENAALRALRKLWSMRSPLNLLGTKLDVVTGKWIDHASGIGAGIGSFYECLVKAHFLFGSNELWRMFESAYLAVQRYIRYESFPSRTARYKTVNMKTGEEINKHLTSYQAFWPGLQVLIGDITSANSTHRDFYSAWKKYGGLPERFKWKGKELEIIERQYPLRPELIESTFYLYQATKDEWYLAVGGVILNTLAWNTKVDYGYASIKDLTTLEKDDHQPGYFLSETCKYLYLLFNDSFLNTGDYIFTTGGHPLPVMSLEFEFENEFEDEFEDEDEWASLVQAKEYEKDPNALLLKVCPVISSTGKKIQSACHVPDIHPDHKCYDDVECGIDPLSCVPRECSDKGTCGDWYFRAHLEEIGQLRKSRFSWASGVYYANNTDDRIVLLRIKDDKVHWDTSVMDQLINQ